MTAWSRGRVNLSALESRLWRAGRTSDASQSTVGSGCDPPLDLAPLRLGLELAHHVLDQRREFHRPAENVLSRDAGEVHQVVDQAGHAVGPVPDAAGVVLHGRIERGTGVVEQELAEAADVAERVAQVVGDGVDHRLELGGGGPKRRAPLGDAPLELAGLPPELLAEPRLLDGDRERRRDLHGDVAVLGGKAAWAVVEARLISPMASASTSSGTLSTLRIPSSRSSRRIADGDSTAAEIVDGPHRAAPQHLDRPRAGPSASCPPGSLRPPRYPAISWAWPRGKSNSTTVQRWHGTIRRMRPSAARPISAGERAARIAWSRSCSTASRSADRRSRSSVRLRSVMSVTMPTMPTGAAIPAGDGARRDQSPDFGTVLASEPEVVALAARAGGAERALRPGPRRGVEEVVDRPSQQSAVLVAQQVGHPLIDVGDDPAVVGDPDPLLGHVDELLEALLALLQRLGAILEPALPRLEGRGVLERGADEAAEQPECLRVAVAEGGGLGREHLEHAEDALIVPERHGEQRANALLAVGVVPDAGVGGHVVRALQVAGAHGQRPTGCRSAGAAGSRCRSSPAGPARRPGSARPPRRWRR